MTERDDEERRRRAALLAPAGGGRLARLRRLRPDSRRTRGALAVTAGVVVAAVAGITAIGLTREAEAPATAAQPTSGDSVVPLCGVADVGRYVAPVDPDGASVVQVLAAAATADGPSPWLAAAGEHVAALSVTDDVATLVRYGLDGSEEGRTDLAGSGSAGPPRTFALAPDGLVVAPAGADALVGIALDGDRAWETDLDTDLGAVVAVLGWTAGDPDAVAAVVTAGAGTAQLVDPDGGLRDSGVALPQGTYFPQDDGTLFVATQDDAGTTLTHYDAAGAVAGTFSGPASGGSANGGPAGLAVPVSIATAPGGDGYLVMDPSGVLVTITADGVWSGVAVSGAGNGPGRLTTAQESPLVAADGRYYFFTPQDDDGRALATTDTAGMRTALEAPMTYDIATAGTTARLGYGAGLQTGATYDYFASGDAPRVQAVFAPWWGDVADRYELRYTVQGDPSLPTPVAGTSGTLDLPADGGTVDLTLPEAAPGPYEVHAELVERETGAVRTATCLRYAVGAPGAAFAPDDLDGQPDWGGAAPLRGVQLAGQLGIGMTRVQLDFGALVPDPLAQPSAAGLDLDALGGMGQLADAAALAAETGVQLYVQVGQGGDAEHAAVQAGTWEGWVAQIVAAVADGAPDVDAWAPWNEPNNTGFGDGGDYATQVLAPFAEAVHSTSPGAVVVGGNALNVNVGWYEQAIAAGACASWDVVGIHPYTGFNRSWDEEGDAGPLGQIAALRAALTACGTDEIWDTESGWWSDGPANHWSQAYDVARTTLEMRSLGVTRWLYFYDEGGWGEGNFSWSLLQFGSFVKPGALAMSTVATVLDGRGEPVEVGTGADFVHGLEFPGDADTLTALWTSDVATDVAVTSAVDASVTLTDVYGGTQTLDLVAGVPATMPVSGAPVYLAAPPDADLAVDAGVGPDLLADGSATAAASSTANGSDPAGVLDRAGGWTAAATRSDGTADTKPWLQVDLAQAGTLDAVYVESAGIRCCSAGLRDYTVSVRTDGTWTQVADVTDQFLDRGALLRFDAVEADAVRIQVPTRTERGVEVADLNYSGQTAGLHPAWVPLATTDGWTASIVSLQAFGPPSP